MSKNKTPSPPKAVETQDKVGADEWEKEIKAKNEELDEVKEQLTQEKNEKEKLQKQLEAISNGQSDTNKRLARAQDISEKLRAENQKKTEYIEKLERTISHMEDRIRNLEIRAYRCVRLRLSVQVCEITVSVSNPSAYRFVRLRCLSQTPQRTGV
ncbi:hypothetical protein PoB_000373300 [Plakobranchus ocellatus]|uniref:Uncharacterized protein n=1 Tax=Plakobranchus ocellatus TaxID=259542 RepID=A0AAV3Y4W6_9GAST|nr:hypothetical protein PoB_000373300 [Plakobranchus ocellatus]